VNVNTGDYQALPGLPVGTPAHLGLSSITVVDTDVKLNDIQGVVSRYDTTISSLEIGGSNGSGDLQIATGTLDSVGDVTVTGNGTLTIDAGATLNSGGTFTNNPNGFVTITGSLDATGQNVNNSGIMRIDGDLLGTLNNESGATVSGTGMMGDLVIESGSSIAPGNSVGEIEAANVTWEGNGSFEFEVNDFTLGGAGTTWDLLTANELTFTESGAGNYALSVSSLDGATTGEALNFDQNSNYSLLFAQANSLSGFDPSLFAIDASGFESENVVNPEAVWSVSSLGTNLFLNYTVTAIPEPTSFGLLGLLGLAYSARRRRRL